MKKIVLYISLIVVMLVAVNKIEKMVVEGEEQLITTFSDINFDMKESDINIWSEYSQSYMTKKQMIELGNSIAQKLNLKPEFNSRYIDRDLLKIYEIKKQAKYVNTVIKIAQHIEEVDNNGLRVENYIVVNMTFNNKYDSVFYYKDKIKEIFKEMNLKPIDNLTLTSTYDGKIEKNQMKEIVNKVLHGVSGNIVDSFETEDIYSVYAYSNYIPQYIISNGDKVNIDIALTYNENENLTYLYIAVPVITIEY